MIAGRVVRRAGCALWLQDSSSFVDLRGPGPTGLDGPRIFAGRTTWASPELRWHHLLDSLREADTEDVGRITRRDDQVLVESGLFPGPDGPIAYRERWERLLQPDEVAIRIDSDGVLVHAGRPLPVELRIPPTGFPQARGPDPPGHFGRSSLPPNRRPPTHPTKEFP